MQLSGFRIATIRGIPIRIHISLVLVLPLVAYGFARAFLSAADLAGVPASRLSGGPWLWGLGVAVALFASVLVHELAHSLYALRHGGRVRDITLLMVGGVSEMSEAPRHARDEAIMALVGPLASLGIASVLFLLYAGSARASFNLRFAMFYLGSLNLFLGAFNLLPAFPMDGGRILRALLTSRMGLVRATHIAARVGKVFAVLFAVWGFLTFNMLLLLIAFFVFVGAEAETRAVMVKALLGRLRVRDVMSFDIASIPADITVHEGGERMLEERRTSFAVTLDGHPIGLLTLEAIQAVPPDKREHVLVREVATPARPLSPTEDAARALRLMSDTDVPQITVVDHGDLIGMVSRDDIVRSLKLTELESSQHPGVRVWMRRRGEAPA